jgi:L-alanine-DL-glutamate epimerase-like enolase superfamily enzyme
MKIAEIETFPVAEGGRTYLFVTIETDSGIVGVGEAALFGRELAVIGAIDTSGHCSLANTSTASSTCERCCFAADSSRVAVS